MSIAIIAAIIGAVGAVGAAAASGLFIIAAPFVQRAIGQLLGIS